MLSLFLLIFGVAICYSSEEDDGFSAYTNAQRQWVKECTRRPPSNIIPSMRVGVFFQVKSLKIWPDMLTCLSSVAEAQNYAELGVHVILAGTASEQYGRSLVESSVRALVPNLHVTVVDNAGTHIGHFLQQIADANHSSAKYDILLKIHSETHDEWRKLGFPSMCGTVAQVKSILTQFAQRPEMDLIAPVGTIFYPGTLMSDVAPIVSKTQSWENLAQVPTSLTLQEEEGMELLRKSIFPELKIGHESWATLAGGMFWVRHSAMRPKTWAARLNHIGPHLTRKYDRAIERFIPTMIQNGGGTLATMPPAPKVYAIYFPQYHRFPENDKFWGAGFTEWTLLKPLNLSGIRKPLGEDRGGLGFYDLTEKRIRKCQANLARNFGVEGFMYYHYWFTDSNGNRPVMQRVPELMLADGEPNLPFFFSWANEPWSRRWDGMNKDILLGQEYGDEPHWTEHAEYLMKFFKHDRYLKTSNRPVFAIYRPGHLEAKLAPMLQTFDKVARRHGFDGVYLVNTVGNFYKVDGMHKRNKFPNVLPSAFHFFATLDHRSSTRIQPSIDTRRISSVADLDFVREKRQFWGAFTGFDNVVRYPQTPYRQPVDPLAFQLSLAESFKAMGYNAAANLHDGLDNLFMIGAWNEWNEQCTMEPDDILGFKHLQALQNALESIIPREVSKNMLGKQTLNIIRLLDEKMWSDRHEYVADGSCADGTWKNTVWSESVDDCCAKAMANAHKSVNAFVFAREGSECAFYSGVCSKGDNRKQYKTYRIKPWGCKTSEGSGCKTCIPEDMRVSASDCASCHDGYHLWGVTCEKTKPLKILPFGTMAAKAKPNLEILMENLKQENEHLRDEIELLRETQAVQAMRQRKNEAQQESIGDALALYWLARSMNRSSIESYLLMVSWICLGLCVVAFGLSYRIRRWLNGRSPKLL